MPRLLPHPHSKIGFTFLEMAIVLTVIGLIAGSIVVVRDLIRNAEVQSVINDEDRYKKAIQLFKEKYNYLPGDMPTATNFWGAEASCPTAYSATEAVPKTATCNGDGNGRIDTFAEAMRAWQQLANAGFIEGMYSGIQANANGNSLAVGTNVPASKIPKCGWTMGYLPNIVSPIAGGPGLVVNQGTFLQLSAGGLDLKYPPCLTPIEGYGIDSKIDDGIPTTGNVIDGGAALYTQIAPLIGVWSANPAIIAAHDTPNWVCEQSPYSQYNIGSSVVYCDPFFNTGL